MAGNAVDGRGSVDGVGADAVDAADAVLGAFYQQDQRERHLVHGDAEAAAEAESRANERMATAFAAEFPGLDTEVATRAGTRFMHALYLQDEIENWEYVAQQRDELGIERRLFSEIAVPVDTRQAADPRWEHVEEYLGDVCTHADIDPAYATRQTRFWKLHGQVEDDWRDDALAAHRLKLQSMIPSADDATIDALAETFVEGVSLHDDWDHQDREADLRHARETVASYYQRVFDVRAEDA